MKWIFVTAFFCMVFGFLPKAHAQDWILCDTCVTSGQYQMAAIARHGESPFLGPVEYAVGNPTTGYFEYVTVTYVPPGDPNFPQVPMSVGTRERRSESSLILQSGQRALRESVVTFINSNPGEYVSQDYADVNQQIYLLQNGGHQVSSHQPSAGERAQFQAIVPLARDQVLFNAPPNIFGFESYSGAVLDNLAGVDSAIRVAMTTINPAWLNNEMSPNLLRTLWNALDQHYGKGPTGCVVFYNGDSACFQINPLAPGAARVIDGTAKDKNGNLIPSHVATVPNGGERGLDVLNDTPRAGYTSWGPLAGGGSYWLSCTNSGGDLVGCYLHYVAQ